VFADLETSLANAASDPGGDGLDWTRADTIAYIGLNPFELSEEAPRKGGADNITAGLGDDLVFAQEGDDNVFYAWGDGHDFVHGGINKLDAGGASVPDNDQFHLNIAGAGGTVFMETVAAYETRTGNNYVLGGALSTDALNGTDVGFSGILESQIILISNADSDITAGIGVGHEVFVELVEIEEVVVTGSAADDTFDVGGAFTGTALTPTTIFFNGLEGNDTLDLFDRDSAHHVDADGGPDTGSGDQDKVILDFAFTDITNLVVTGSGFEITHGTPPDEITDIFDNFETFVFTDVTKTAAQLADQTPPTVSIVVDDTSLNIGDDSLVTFTFSEVPTDFTGADVTVQNGSIGAISPTGDPLVFTAVLTPNAGVEDATNVVTVGTGWTDPAANPPAAATDSNNYAVDTVRPTVSIVVDDTALNIGDSASVSFTFSETPVGFNNADISAQNGTLGALENTPDPLTVVATLSPNGGVTDATNVVTAGAVWTDLAGNAPAASTDSNNYAVDTVRPTVSIVVDDTSLNIGDTALVTFTFSEVPTGFDAGDVTVQNGSIGAISPTGDPLVFTATLTPQGAPFAVQDPTNVISVGTDWTDAAGNAPAGVSTSNNYLVDTVRPGAIGETVTGAGIVSGSGILNAGDVATIAVTYSEPVNVTGTPVLALSSGGTATYTGGSGTDTLTFSYTVQAGENTDDVYLANYVANGATILDLNGNAPHAGDIDGFALGGTLVVDTTAPTVTDVTVNDLLITDADVGLGTFSVQVTFSEAMNTGATPTLTFNPSVAGVLAFASGAWSAGDTVYTATYNVTDGNVDIDDITIDVTGAQDVAGNAQANYAEQNEFDIEMAPTNANPVAGDDTLYVSEQTSVTIPIAALLANDTDADLDTITITSVSNITGDFAATVTLLSDGTIFFSVGSGTGTGTFTYDISDGAGGTDTGTVTVNRLDTSDSSSDNIDLSALSYAYSYIDPRGQNDTVTGSANPDFFYGQDENDILNGGGGSDTLTGGLGNDTVDGGTGSDIIIVRTAIGGTSDSNRNAIGGNGNDIGDDRIDNFDLSNDTLRIVATGISGNFAHATNTTIGTGGAGNTGADATSYTTLTGLISINGDADFLDGEDVVVTFNTPTGTFNEANFEARLQYDLLGTNAANTLTGGSLADTINGGSGNDTINGGGGGDLLIGGVGTDTIDTGAADDNVQDIVRFVTTGEAGDTVNNFDLTGTLAQTDLIQFAGTFGPSIDDGATVGTLDFQSGDGVDGGNNSVNFTNIEALFLNGLNGEGVAAGDIGDATDVMNEFNAEFDLSGAANGETTLLVVQSTTSNASSVWLWTQASSGEIGNISELSRIGTFNANGAISTGNFDLA
jgi:hypothetical protein